jgi:hypothetical protein
LDPFQAGNIDIEDRIRLEDVLVIVASPEYRLIADGDLVSAKEWRAWVSRQVHAHRRERGILPVILPGGSPDDIPGALRSKKIEHFAITDFTLLPGLQPCFGCCLHCPFRQARHRAEPLGFWAG